MDSVPFPPKFRQPKLQFYIRATFAYQHVVHFNIIAGSIAGIANYDALKIRLLVSRFQEAAFHWYIQIPGYSITSWASIEEKFLLHFQ